MPRPFGIRDQGHQCSRLPYSPNQDFDPQDEFPLAAVPLSHLHRQRSDLNTFVSVKLHRHRSFQLFIQEIMSIPGSFPTSDESSSMEERSFTFVSLGGGSRYGPNSQPRGVLPPIRVEANRLQRLTNQWLADLYKERCSCCSCGLCDRAANTAAARENTHKQEGEFQLMLETQLLNNPSSETAQSHLDSMREHEAARVQTVKNTLAGLCNIETVAAQHNMPCAAMRANRAYHAAEDLVRESAEVPANKDNQLVQELSATFQSTRSSGIQFPATQGYSPSRGRIPTKYYIIGQYTSTAQGKEDEQRKEEQGQPPNSKPAQNPALITVPDDTRTGGAASATVHESVVSSGPQVEAQPVVTHGGSMTYVRAANLERNRRASAGVPHLIVDSNERAIQLRKEKAAVTLALSNAHEVVATSDAATERAKKISEENARMMERARQIVREYTGNEFFAPGSSAPVGDTSKMLEDAPVEKKGDKKAIGKECNIQTITFDETSEKQKLKVSKEIQKPRQGSAVVFDAQSSSILAPPVAKSSSSSQANDDAEDHAKTQGREDDTNRNHLGNAPIGFQYPQFREAPDHMVNKVAAQLEIKRTKQIEKELKEKGQERKEKGSEPIAAEVNHIVNEDSKSENHDLTTAAVENLDRIRRDSPSNSNTHRGEYRDRQPVSFAYFKDTKLFHALCRSALHPAFSPPVKEPAYANPVATVSPAHNSQAAHQAQHEGNGSDADDEGNCEGTGGKSTMEEKVGARSRALSFESAHSDEMKRGVPWIRPGPPAKPRQEKQSQSRGEAQQEEPPTEHSAGKPTTSKTKDAPSIPFAVGPRVTIPAAPRQSRGPNPSPECNTFYSSPYCNHYPHCAGSNSNLHPHPFQTPSPSSVTPFPSHYTSSPPSNTPPYTHSSQYLAQPSSPLYNSHFSSRSSNHNDPYQPYNSPYASTSSPCTDLSDYVRFLDVNETDDSQNDDNYFAAAYSKPSSFGRRVATTHLNADGDGDARAPGLPACMLLSKSAGKDEPEGNSSGEKEKAQATSPSRSQSQHQKKGHPQDRQPPENRAHEKEEQPGPRLYNIPLNDDSTISSPAPAAAAQDLLARSILTARREEVEWELYEAHPSDADSKEGIVVVPVPPENRSVIEDEDGFIVI
ncbi:hypothetical protein MKZ38_002889 [Zalerion maritima]|uniref:Uncharacterized protein n=1 Tax=Zalerion maritima TaxID=339359 RepID=A0AAD5WX88_9PEZI|nr:hypothetical protein MKZ38_002889 [Zalerion maritima]